MSKIIDETSKYWEWKPDTTDERTEKIILAEGAVKVESYRNYLYKVIVAYFSDDTARISIRDWDGSTNCKESWRNWQRIKDELLPNGKEEWEAVQVFASSNRTVDESNHFHLWAVKGRLAVGWYGNRTFDVNGQCNDEQRNKGHGELYHYLGHDEQEKPAEWEPPKRNEPPEPIHKPFRPDSHLRADMGIVSGTESDWMRRQYK